jgi:hypothetical protein
MSVKTTGRLGTLERVKTLAVAVCLLSLTVGVHAAEDLPTPTSSARLQHASSGASGAGHLRCLRKKAIWCVRILQERE